MARLRGLQTDTEQANRWITITQHKCIFVFVQYLPANACQCLLAAACRLARTLFLRNASSFAESLFYPSIKKMLIPLTDEFTITKQLKTKDGTSSLRLAKKERCLNKWAKAHLNDGLDDVFLHVILFVNCKLAKKLSGVFMIGLDY